MAELTSYQYNPPAEPVWRPKIAAFLCNWCSYAGADLTGSLRQKYPATVRVIRVPCSARINPQFVLRAFMKGVDGVLISGCHPGDCHYMKGNYYTRRRMKETKKLLEFIGLEPERFQLRWISASEALKFAETVTAMTEDLYRLGPNENLKICQII